MEIEGLICPACAGELKEDQLKDQLVCPHCKTNLKQKVFSF